MQKLEKLATVLTPDGYLIRLSVIEFAENLWLVTKWMTHKTEPLKRPERLVQLIGLQFEATENPDKAGADYLVSEPIPKPILEGKTPIGASGKFVVLDKPNVTFPSSTH